VGFRGKIRLEQTGFVLVRNAGAVFADSGDAAVIFFENLT
jgi:hypothetical protein